MPSSNAVPDGPVTIAADRADVLAQLTAAGIDEGGLALRLLFPHAPHPLDAQPVWDGIHATPGDCFLHLNTAGRPGCGPLVELPATGATLGRLCRATARDPARLGRSAPRPGSGSQRRHVGRAGLHQPVFPRRRTGTAVAFHQRSVDPGNEDAVWAKTAARALPWAEQLVADLSDLPGKYAPPGDCDPEDVYFWVRSLADLRAIAGMLAATGSRVHLAGHGGDEVLTAAPSYLHMLVRRHPLTAIGHIRGYQAVRRWRTSTLLRELADRSRYAQWLRRCTDLLLEPPPDCLTPNLSWGGTPRLPSWTPPAAEFVADQLSEAVRSQPPTTGPHPPPAPDAVPRGRVRPDRPPDPPNLPSRERRPRDPLPRRPGGRDRPRGASTRLRPPRALQAPADRGDDRHRAALNLARSTKGEFSAETYLGLRRHRAKLLDLLDSSVLAERGLVDQDALRRAAAATYPRADPLWRLDMTLACELWLRAQQSMALTPNRRSP
ncbi:asparagine synthase (glutamine-hydrolysing) [Nocardia amikacinitolerans]|uniref:Asparagine synthase (Glutamine-hydrolysing) n=1 Tax=Nocardia amikacinitolerans TaxID=756689 RepID=A0A285KXT3_9NOCA|nr:asparagine synthase-related protein [Nocardia amikacinitolerans]SNY77478.1 asparagine synthase (glutamine-hydrolysing) [Nocardia amikacinitolerans]